MSGARLVDVDRVLSRLKRFQRDTVDHVFRQLFLEPGSTRRYLVADEVGLGKTLVAKGVMARAIDHLQSAGVRRIDVVYVCSNTEIARQNIARLNVTDSPIAPVPRMTMLPKVMGDLKNQRLNLVALTPGTSFDLRSSMGIRDERVVLYWMLRRAWGLGDETGPKNLLQGYVGNADSFRRELAAQSEMELDQGLIRAFKKALKEEHGLRARFDEAASAFRNKRKTPRPNDHRSTQTSVVGELRAVLAGVCVAALEPDLVILDEFQRFKNLLTGDDDAALLARALFEWEKGHECARVLLLSATPYKMLTLDSETGDENHHEDFLSTVGFLLGNGAPAEPLKALLQAFRQELYRADGGDYQRLREIRWEIEAILRRVMVRTERLAVTENRDGMVSSMLGLKPPVGPAEVAVYPALAKVAGHLGAGEVIEYWKSAPYLLNFMESYELKSKLDLALQGEEGSAIGQALCHCKGALLPWSRVTDYSPLDVPNARLGSLQGDVLDREAWRLLWIPPSLAYYRLEGPFGDSRLAGFTKRLVFSSWAVVPRAVAGLLSYEAERRIATSYQPDLRNTAEARKARKPPLVFTKSEGRLTGMSVLPLLYPSTVLAQLGDPLEHATTGSLLPHHTVIARVQKKIAAELRRIPGGRKGGRVDERWYWLAPVLLDLAVDQGETDRWLTQAGLADLWSSKQDDPEGDEGPTRWADHVQELVRVARASGDVELGRQPRDLARVLAQLAVAGPATCALRAFRRVAPEADGVRLRNGAAAVGWGFRALFNSPESTALIRGLRPEEPYWQRVLEYSLDGCLQAVLDEYAHVLCDHLGLTDALPDKVVEGLAVAMQRALTIRTASLKVDNIEATASSCRKHAPRSLRAHFALHFGHQRLEDGREGVRSDRVRDAFNSPFWPFVLVTTSVGQEGLDFHLYCHAVVHWNLPSNPVDLEQREGRVHRFKGHAIRKNVAQVHRRSALAGLGPGDPWARLFDAAWQSVGHASRDVQPFWVFAPPGGARIERYVLAAPLSRDLLRYEALKRTLAVYRLAFGQPRQEDLLAFLAERLSPEQLKAVLDTARIDLGPCSGSEPQDARPHAGAATRGSRK